MKGFGAIILLLLSNVFMTLAWYGHLKFSENKKLAGLGLIAIIISWGIAFFHFQKITLFTHHFLFTIDILINNFFTFIFEQNKFVISIIRL
jgi:hypothetical protein